MKLGSGHPVLDLGVSIDPLTKGVPTTQQGAAASSREPLLHRLQQRSVIGASNHPVARTRNTSVAQLAVAASSSPRTGLGVVRAWLERKTPRLLPRGADIEVALGDVDEFVPA